jgi:hypothetical protein
MSAVARPTGPPPTTTAVWWLTGDGGKGGTTVAVSEMGGGRSAMDANAHVSGVYATNPIIKNMIQGMMLLLWRRQHAVVRLMVVVVFMVSITFCDL